MKTLEVIAGAAAVLCLLLLVECYRELHRFQVTTYTIRSPKLRGVKASRAVFLSDLHNQIYGLKNQTLIQAVRETKPDLILIGGDMLVARRGQSFLPALETVRALAQIAPVYYANGNHEQRMKECPQDYDGSFLQYKRALTAEGVTFLENETAAVLFGECSVMLSGLEIPRRFYTHIRKVRMEADVVSACHHRQPGGDYQILLAHNPTYMDRYLEWGADLVLSGHLHGGVVRVPGLGGVISPGLELFPRYSGGHYRTGEQDVVVSRGLGVHTIPVRLFNPAELIVLNFSCETDGCSV